MGGGGSEGLLVVVLQELVGVRLQDDERVVQRTLVGVRLQDHERGVQQELVGVRLQDGLQDDERGWSPAWRSTAAA